MNIDDEEQIDAMSSAPSSVAAPAFSAPIGAGARTPEEETTASARIIHAEEYSMQSTASSEMTRSEYTSEVVRRMRSLSSRSTALVHEYIQARAAAPPTGELLLMHSNINILDLDAVLREVKCGDDTDDEMYEATLVQTAIGCFGSLLPSYAIEPIEAELSAMTAPSSMR
jgi:hypothetical protein